MSPYKSFDEVAWRITHTVKKSSRRCVALLILTYRRHFYNVNFKVERSTLGGNIKRNGRRNVVVVKPIKKFYSVISINGNMESYSGYV